MAEPLTLAGSVTYNIQSSMSVVKVTHVIPNEGYEFLNWNDGETMPTRTVSVVENAEYIAYFNDTTSTTITHTITAISYDVSMGTVIGGGTYPEGTVITLTAVPTGIYVFEKWSDGNTDNPRTVTVSEDMVFIAHFKMPQLYTITVQPNNPEMGTVSGGGEFPMGTEIVIQAEANGGYYFDGWDDDNTDAIRTVTVTGNHTYTAMFSSHQIQYFTVNVTCNPAHGYVEGGGNYQAGATTTIKAIPWNPDEFVFVKWNDGNTSNPRNITVTDNITYVATFGPAAPSYYIGVISDNEEMGTVTGAGTYEVGAQVTITATAKPGYIFLGWGDGVIDNPRTITVTHATEYVAYFQGNAVDEFNTAAFKVYPNPANESIRIDGLENETEICIYNSLGMMVKMVSVNADQEINVSDLSAGLYMIRCGKQTLRFVKE